VKKKKGKVDFIKKHEFAGGKKALQEIISKNLVYPSKALEKKIEGRVYLEYTVGFSGDVESVKILKGIGFGCDEEAIRLVKLLKFSPQNNHGVKLISTHKLQINFKIPEIKKTNQPTTITYTTSTIKTKQNITEKPKTVFSYTIKL
jgi:protein TonB